MSTSDLELLKHFRNNAEWFDNNYQNLQKYDGQFIAIYKENVIDSDNDCRRLVGRIKNLHDKSLYITLITIHGTPSPTK
jgi:hypothetical protein